MEFTYSDNIKKIKRLCIISSEVLNPSVIKSSFIEMYPNITNKRIDEYTINYFYKLHKQRYKLNISNGYEYNTLNINYSQLTSINYQNNNY